MKFFERVPVAYDYYSLTGEFIETKEFLLWNDDDLGFSFKKRNKEIDLYIEINNGLFKFAPRQDIVKFLPYKKFSSITRYSDEEVDTAIKRYLNLLAFI